MVCEQHAACTLAARTATSKDTRHLGATTPWLSMPIQARPAPIAGRDAQAPKGALLAPPWAECTHRLRSMHALALPRTWWLGRRRSCCHGGCKRRRAAASRWDAACWPAWRRGADALRCCGFDEGCARRRWQQGTPWQLQFSKSRAKSNAQRAARTAFGRGTFCCMGQKV